MKLNAHIIRAFALLLATILFIGLVSAKLESKAAGTVQLNVTNAIGKAGDDITISINISANSGLGAATLLLKFDTTKLTYKSNKPGPATSGGSSSINPSYKTEGDYVTINDSYINMNGTTVGGSMLDIVFTIKSGWSGSSAITLTTPDFVDSVNYETIEHNITNGSISVGATTTAATTTTSTTKPSTTTSTTKPATTQMPTTKPATSALTTATTLPNGPTQSTGIITTMPTTAPIAVPVDKVESALGPDAADWDKNVANLNNEQKQKIEEYFAAEGTPVTIGSDAVYYLETTAVNTSTDDGSVSSESTSISADDTDGMTSGVKAIITIAAVCAILAVALIVAYVKRKNGKV